MGGYGWEREIGERKGKERGEEREGAGDETPSIY